MKVKQAARVAVRWSGRDAAKALEILLKQVELDPELAAQVREECKLPYIEKLVNEAIDQRGYSLERQEELTAAVGFRLAHGRWPE